MHTTQNISDFTLQEIDRFPLPVVCGKILLDENDDPIDLVFQQSNSLFENLKISSGNSGEVKKLSELSAWISTKLVIDKLKDDTSENHSFEVFVDLENKWYEFYLQRHNTSEFTLLVNDISERRTAEIELRKSYQTFRGIYENASVGIYFSDANGNMLMANKALLNLLNYDSFETFSLNNLNNLRMLINYSQEEYNRKLKDEGQIKSVESLWQTKNGNALYVLESARVVTGANPEELYIEGIVEDISAKKIAENQLKQLNNIFLDLGVDIKKNIQTIVKMTNQILNGACSIYNRLDKKKDSLVVWANYNAPDDLELKVNSDGHICYEATIKGQDKTVAISDISQTPYYDSDPTVKKYDLKSYLGHPVKVNGTVIGSLCIVDTQIREFTDTEKEIISTLAIALSLESERELLQTRLEASRLEAETANEAKSRFLANMSHEIRTPLNGIMGFTEILITREEDEKKRRMLRMINESGDQLLQIINDIFDYSMIEAGKLSRKESEFSLNEIISDTASYFMPYAHNKGIDLIVNIEEGDDRNLFGDQNKLTQVLFNLVSNAIKFTEEGTVMILAKNKITGPNAEVEVIVEDTGIGIDPEKLETIFEEFEQLEYYLTKKTRGTGLGLAIARKLVHFLNGSIALESEAGKGSRFIVNLSFQVNTSKKNKVIMNDPKETPARKPGTVNILLAEDNEANQFLIKAITKFENWEITVVDDGELAVNEFKSGNFDLILMDVQMPVMNGYEATQLIREIEKGKDIHTPIIALTAYAMKSDKDQCIEAGMDDYISKPFKKQQFLDTIQAMLDKNK